MIVAYFESRGGERERERERERDGKTNPSLAEDSIIGKTKHYSNLLSVIVCDLCQLPCE